MGMLAEGVRNVIGVLVTLFVVRILDSLSTIVFRGERISQMISRSFGGD